MVTIKALADELGVSKVAINNRLAKAGLKSELIKEGNTYLLSDEVAEEIRSAYRRKHEGKASRTHEERKANAKQSDVIEVLSRQLEEKDRQIEKLTQMLETSQEQVLSLTQSVQQSHLLLADSKGLVKDAVPAEEVTEVTEEAPAPERKGFMRWFK